MTDCGHLALIASGEARGLCPLCQKAEIERLRGFQDAAADLEDRLEEAEAEIKQLRTALEEIADLSSVSVRAPHIARAALAGKP